MDGRVQVLGAVAVPGSDLPPRVRRLLAALLVRHGSVVPADTLLDAVWPGPAPEHGEAALQTAVSRLRSALRKAGLDGALVTTSPGYRLTLPRDRFDATHLEDLQQRAGDRPAAQAAALLDEALALPTGPPYAEFADDDFARPEAARLAELLATAAEARAEAALELGHAGEAIAYLDRLVAGHPYREHAHALLIRAVAASGRPADALAHFDTVRRRLAADLGLDPSPALRSAQARVLRAEEGPRLERPGSIPVLIHGRGDDVSSVRALLHRARVVTLTGPGGVGKTTLAFGVATGQPATVVELARVERPQAVAEAVATALQVPHGEEPAARRIGQVLRGRYRLLVLDNCEQVVGAVAELVEEILAAAPDVTVLATSREALGVTGEHVHPVAPLTLEGEEAAAPWLFEARAQAVAPAFRLTDENREAVTEICRRLDGLPLAIELAAARMTSMTPEELLPLLGARLRFLRSARRLADERHRTLLGVVDWSYRLLDPAPQQAFTRLAMFAGAFDAPLAAAMTGHGAPEAHQTLDTLVTRSMLVATNQAGRTRFTMLETLRLFGREQLGDDLDAVSRTHAETLVAAVEDLGPRVTSPGGRQAAEAIEALTDDLRQAHTWALPHAPALAGRLVAALADHAEFRMPPELFGWADRTLTTLPDDDPSFPAVLTVAAAGARFAGDLDRADRLVARALSTGENRPPALTVAADVRLFQGRFAESLTLAEELERTARAAGDHHRTGMGLANQVVALAYDDDVAEAMRRCADLRRHAGDDTPVTGWARYVEGEILLDRDPAKAIPLLEEALTRARADGDRYLAGVALVSAASGQARHGDPARARDLFAEVVEHWRRTGNRTQQRTTLRNVVPLLVTLGEDEAAARLIGALEHPGAFGQEAERMAITRADLAARRPDLVRLLEGDGSPADLDDVVDPALAALRPRR